jgi:hypothetical protein
MFFIFFPGSRGMGFVGMMLLVVGLAIVPLVMVLGLGGAVVEQVFREQAYKSQYGDAWKTHFETDRGSLSDARTKATVAGCGAVMVTGLYFYLYKEISGAIRRRMGTAPRKRKRRRSSSSRSPSQLSSRSGERSGS